MTDAESGLTQYTYDSLNRLMNLTDFSNHLFTFSYDALSRRTQLTRANGVNTNYVYDTTGMSRLLSITHQKSGTTLDGASYTYDNAGNRASRTALPGTTATNFSYDAIYQLLTATFTIASNAQAGGASFTVTTPSGTSNSWGIDVVGVPILNSISPADGARGTSFKVTLSGSQFTRTQIQFSSTGITATNRTVNYPLFTMLTYTFTIASNAPTGPQSVTLTNPAGTSASVTFTVQ